MDMNVTEEGTVPKIDIWMMRTIQYLK